MINQLILKNRKILTIINIFAAVLALLAVMMFFRDVISLKYKKPAYKTDLSSVNSATKKYTLTDYEIILRNNPFGIQGGQLKSLSASSTGRSSSSSEMKLIGTVAGGGLGYAIFTDKNGKQEVFKIGDDVFGAGKLKAVHKDKALLLENGKIIDIALTDILIIKDAVNTQSGAAGDFVKSAGANNFILNQKKVYNALENPNQLMTDARLQPNLVNGQQQGYILREVRSGGIYQSLGLIDGDALLRINEYEITNPEAALKAFTALQGTDKIQLDIVRNGSKMTMNYQIR
jgi:general secretion pathway protein C